LTDSTAQIIVRGIVSHLQIRSSGENSQMRQSEAGTEAEESGIYKVVHENNHFSRHYVITLKGDTLPG